MNEENRKTLAVGIFLGLIVLLSILAILWNSLFNRASISIEALAPFEVEIFGGDSQKCTESPCKIKEKSGIATLILTKEGYKTIVEDFNFPLWRTNKITINFEINPYIKEVSQIPSEDEKIQYQIVKDTQTNYYKLVVGDSSQSLIYFPSKITNPTIFGGNKAVLIIDESNATVYKVDLDTNTKRALSVNMPKVEDGTFSVNKKFFIFEESQTKKYWIFDTENNKLKTLPVSSIETKYAWMQNKVVLATQFDTTASDKSTLSIVPTNLTGGINILLFDPETDKTSQIKLLEGLDNTPQSIVPTTNEQIIYLDFGDKKIALYIK